VEATAAQAPTLNITIDSKRNDAALEPSEAIQVPELEPSDLEAIQSATIEAE
jgi:hypothetical protein